MAKQAKYTPGPWEISQRGDGKVIFVEAKGDGWHRLDCEVSRDDCDTATAEANARLIAAAPNGHEIAEWALKVCEALDNTDLGHLAMNSEGEYLQDAIHAYLAKVRGEK